MKNINQLEINITKSFSKVREDITLNKKEIIENKNKLVELKKQLEEAIKLQNKAIKQIYENQKHLLIRVRDIEKLLNKNQSNKKIILEKKQ